MTDIIVIGGGMAGLSAAARLSADANVTLLEAEDSLGYHASGRSAALLEKNYGAASVQALNRASEAYLRDHDGGYLSPRGLMLLAHPNEDAGFVADMQYMALTEITPAEACAMIPVLDPAKLHRAAYHADAQDIDTDRLLQGFAKTLRRNGGQVLTRRRVDLITRTGQHWEVRAGNHVYHAPLLVNAAGAWADDVAKKAGIAPLGIVPHRRSMARIPAPAGADVTGWPIFFGIRESWYAKPDAGALLVSPADEDPVPPHDAWADDITLAQGIARYQDMVTPPVTRMLSSWAGLRSFAPDRTLVLGRDRHVPEFIWCAGQGGYGIQTSPAASQLVADIVMGRASVLSQKTVAALSPDRFS
ncbi:MAG: NAD(P)/FAD-dependent oxidoreductase [Roseobacter sp.]